MKLKHLVLAVFLALSSISTAHAAPGQDTVEAIIQAHPNGGAEMVSDMTMAILTNPALASAFAEALANGTPAQKFALTAAFKKSEAAAKAAGRSDVASSIASVSQTFAAADTSGSSASQNSSSSTVVADSRVSNTATDGAFKSAAPVSPSKP
jgi:hypothetical protein